MKHDEEKIIIELIEDFIKEYNQFPTNTLLRKLNKYSLYRKISDCGGFNYFRKLLGYPVAEKRNQDEVTVKLKNIIDKLGYFPTMVEIKNIDSSLSSAIWRHGGGINYYRKLFDYPTVRNVYSFDEVKEKLVLFVKNNKMPTIETLKQLGESKLVREIKRYGGMREVAKKLGYESQSGYVTIDGHFVSSAKEVLLDNCP